MYVVNLQLVKGVSSAGLIYIIYIYIQLSVSIVTLSVGTMPSRVCTVATINDYSQFTAAYLVHCNRLCLMRLAHLSKGIKPDEIFQIKQSQYIESSPLISWCFNDLIRHFIPLVVVEFPKFPTRGSRSQPEARPQRQRPNIPPELVPRAT